MAPFLVAPQIEEFFTCLCNSPTQGTLGNPWEPFVIPVTLLLEVHNAPHKPLCFPIGKFKALTKAFASSPVPKKGGFEPFFAFPLKFP